MSETPQADSAQLALMELNRQLAAAADRQLAQIAQAQDVPYALYESNVWMTVLDRGDEEKGSPQPSEEWVVGMQIYDLSEHLLVDTEGHPPYNSFREPHHQTLLI